MQKTLKCPPLSSVTDARDAEQLSENRVTHILSVHDSARPALEVRELRCTRVCTVLLGPGGTDEAAMFSAAPLCPCVTGRVNLALRPRLCLVRGVAGGRLLFLIVLLLRC